MPYLTKKSLNFIIDDLQFQHIYLVSATPTSIMPQETTNNISTPTKTKKSRGCLRLLILLILLALGGTWLFSFLFYDGTVRTPGEAVQKAQASVRTMVEHLVASSALQGKAVNQSGRVVEMYSLYEKDFVIEFEYTTSWMLSRKRIRITQPYRVRYGIDTTMADMHCEWKEDSNIVQVGNLKPCVISCERFGLQILEEEEGMWNKIHPDERALAQNQIEAHARDAAAADPAALYLTEMRFVEMLNREASRQQSPTRYTLAPRH